MATTNLLQYSTPLYTILTDPSLDQSRVYRSDDPKFAKIASKTGYMIETVGMYKVTQETLSDSTTRVYQLTVLGLQQLIEKKYTPKLGLPIYIESPSTYLAKIEEMQDGEVKAFALLLIHDYDKHVIPIYCYQNETSKEWDILILDSINHTAVRAYSTELAALSRVDVKIARGVRQSDHSSCYTESLLTLKWVHKSIQSDVGILSRLRVEEEGLFVKRKYFNLPSSWAPHAQRTADIDTSYDNTVLSSKKELSVADYRMANSQDIPFKYTILDKTSNITTTLTSPKPVKIKLQTKGESLAHFLDTATITMKK